MLEKFEVTNKKPDCMYTHHQLYTIYTTVKMKFQMSGTLSFWAILFLFLKSVNCQEIDDTESLETPEQNVMEMEEPEANNACPIKARKYLMDTTRALYQTEFLPALTLTMKSYVDETVDRQCIESVEQINEQMVCLGDNFSQQIQGMDGSIEGRCYDF